MMLRKERVFVLLSMFFLVTVSSSLVLVDAESASRDLEVGVYDDYVEIMSYFENATHASELEIRLYTEGGEGPITIELEYGGQVEKRGFSAEDYLELRVTFEALIEYVDEDKSGSFTAEDTIVQRVPLGDQGVVMYKAPKRTRIDEGSGHRINTVYDYQDTVFNITGYIFEASNTLYGKNLDPTEMKIDLEIDGFPFEEDDSLLALKVIFRSEQEMERDDESGESYTWVESDTTSGFFSWEPTASVDGQEADVTSSTVDEDGEVFVYLCYPRGVNIVHDPKIGVRLTAVGEETPVAEPEQEPTKPWVIPGFPYTSIILGLVIGAFILWLIGKK